MREGILIPDMQSGRGWFLVGVQVEDSMGAGSVYSMANQTAAHSRTGCRAVRFADTIPVSWSHGVTSSSVKQDWHAVMDIENGVIRLSGAVVRLGRALERSGGAVPVRDLTAVHQHTGKQTFRRERQKKIALGHKEDDPEEEQSWQQTI